MHNKIAPPPDIEQPAEEEEHTHTIDVSIITCPFCCTVLAFEVQKDATSMVSSQTHDQDTGLADFQVVVLTAFEAYLKRQRD